MKSFGYLLSLAFVSSCSGISLNTGNPTKPVQRPYQEVEALVDEGKYEDARRIAIEKRVPDYMGTKRIEVSQGCNPILKECSNEGLSIQAVRNCRAKIDLQCDSKYLTRKAQGELRDIRNHLIDRNESDGKSESIAGMCNDGFKWGYLRHPKGGSSYVDAYAGIVNTSIIRTKDLIGEFGSKDKCEEARLLEDDKYSTSEKCHSRYRGPKKTKELFLAVAMVGTGKKSIHFGQSQKCADAVTNGFSFHEMDMTSYKISPIGSSGSDRFIKSCEKVEVVVCELDKDSAVFKQDVY